MTTKLLRNCRTSQGNEIGSIFVVDGTIAELWGDDPAGEYAQVFDLAEALVSPGFVDVHNHGAVGVDVNSATADDLLTVGAYLAKNGVTAWMPTLVPDSDENYRRVIDAIDEVMVRQADLAIAQVIGVHYEGVYASAKMCGALRPEFFRSGRPLEERTTPSAQSGGHPSLVRRGAIDLPKLREGVHMTTLAPEIDGGIELIETLVSQGWIVSIGHTEADAETLDAAFDAGARHLTHLFNAMTGIHHRNMGVAGWGLYNEQVTFDIIADGVHVRPEMISVACHAKSPSKVSLISDSIAPTGLGDGAFDLWGEKITVRNGRTKNERGSIAGSVSTMHDGVGMMRSLGFSDSDIANMASTNPARLLGIDSDRGSIEIGKRADLVALDADGNIKMTMIGGKVVE
ncbi:MAG: N-acetylglucosamine-6-phosphate deacetylase [Pyrinomonadaceae bacterium]|nr:N-acetylglucosamine-6-phosphate deacetylase [Acidobacteriota bacterium]